MNNKDKNLKLLFQELSQNPYKQLNIVFLLISIIPILTLTYILCNNLLICNKFNLDTSRIFILSGVIIVLGYALGYKVVRDIIYKTLAYAMKAKRADELKSQFAMSLAHDLKSPLATITTSVSSLKAEYRGKLTREQEGAIDICGTVSGRMNAIISELLDTYMFEAHMARLDIARFDIGELIREQCREFDMAASAKNIAVKSDLYSKPIVIEADRGKMLRVINNIMNNSIKYTPLGGKVIIKVYPVDDFVRMEFYNNGAPIPKDKLEKIFDKFERLNSAIEGHGLGLAIAKDIVELHSGRIWASVTPGNLNCFVVLLHLAKERATPVYRKSNRLLIIEDDKNFADTLKSLLSTNGYEVIVANDARSGIEKASTKDVGLIILDLKLPEVDDFFVLGSLRKSHKTAHIPIIISTSSIEEGIANKVIDMGADDFIQKPYDITKLLGKIESFLA